MMFLTSLDFEFLFALIILTALIVKLIYEQVKLIYEQVKLIYE